MNKAIYAALALAYAAIHLWALHDHRVDVEARQAPPIAPQATVKESLTPRRDVVTRVGYPVEPIRQEWGEWD